MSQQQTDRELVVKRLRDRFPQNDFGAKDPVLSKLDPHEALKLLAEAMILEQSSLSNREKNSIRKLADPILPILCSLLIFVALGPFLSSAVVMALCFGGYLMGIYIGCSFTSPIDSPFQNAKKAIPDLARHVYRQESLSSLLVLRSFLDPESDRNAYNTVEAAIYRVLMQTKGMASVPLSEAQSDFLRELLLRSRQKDEVVVALLLLLASARDAKVMPIAAELARSALSKHVRMVAAEVYQELR